MLAMPQCAPYLLILLVSLFAACSTVPVDDDQAPTPASSVEPTKQALMDQQFQQARTLFMRHHYEEAAQLLLPLARQGHLDAQYTMGYLYHYGQGVPQSEKESTRWLTTAAARGHVKAQKALQLLDDYYGRTAEPH